VREKERETERERERERKRERELKTIYEIERALFPYTAKQGHVCLMILSWTPGTVEHFRRKKLQIHEISEF
jgi:hypothetical protein